MTKISYLSVDLDHPEGLAWSDRHGLFAGGEAGQIYQVDIATGEHSEVANTGGSILGLAWGPASALYLCDRAHQAVLRFDPGTLGELEDVTSGRGVGLRVPNSPAFDEEGNLFVSDSGDWEGRNGTVVRYPLDGGDAQMVAQELGFANGLAFDSGFQFLYLAESNPGCVSRFPHRAGMLGPREVVRDLPGVVPDGLALTESGAVVVACYRPDSILLIDRGVVVPVAEDPSGTVLAAPTNVAFCRADRGELVAANFAARHLTALRHVGLEGIRLPFTAAVRDV